MVTEGQETNDFVGFLVHATSDCTTPTTTSRGSHGTVSPAWPIAPIFTKVSIPTNPDGG